MATSPPDVAVFRNTTRFPAFTLAGSKVGAVLVATPLCPTVVLTSEMVTASSWSLGKPPWELKRLRSSCCAAGRAGVPGGAGARARSFGSGMLAVVGSKTAVTAGCAAVCGTFPGSPQAAARTRIRTAREGAGDERGRRALRRQRMHPAPEPLRRVGAVGGLQRAVSGEERRNRLLLTGMGLGLRRIEGPVDVVAEMRVRRRRRRLEHVEDGANLRAGIAGERLARRRRDHGEVVVEDVVQQLL